eukprot:364282-Chlamydomonas_euryale.AAC.36
MPSNNIPSPPAHTTPHSRILTPRGRHCPWWRCRVPSRGFTQPAAVRGAVAAGAIACARGSLQSTPARTARRTQGLFLPPYKLVEFQWGRCEGTMWLLPSRACAFESGWRLHVSTRTSHVKDDACSASWMTMPGSL